MNTKRKVIEMVCKGNVGRSPVVELIANNYLRDKGVAEDYIAVSSGTDVDKIRAGDFSPDELALFVKSARNMGYNDSSISKLAGALDSRDQKAIVSYTREFTDFLINDETRNRNEILRSLGIEGIAKRTSDQTIARSDVFAVLPVDTENYAKVLDIYNGSGYAPLIGVMSTLATGKLGAEIEGITEPSEDFRDVFRRQIEQIIEETPQAIRKIVCA